MSLAGAVMGSTTRTEMLLHKLLPKTHAKAIMDGIRGPAGRSMWQKLSNVDCEVLAAYLRNEYPQTVAVILSKIKPDNTARVSARCRKTRHRCRQPQLKMEAVQKESARPISSRRCADEFISTLSHTAKRDAHETMAEVFNAFDRQTEARFLAALDEINRHSAKRIRALMFTFEDLTKLDAAATQTIMRQIDKETLSRALKGASEPISRLFPRQHVDPRRQAVAGRHGDHGPRCA